MNLSRTVLSSVLVVAMLAVVACGPTGTTTSTQDQVGPGDTQGPGEDLLDDADAASPGDADTIGPKPDTCVGDGCIEPPPDDDPCPGPRQG